MGTARELFFAPLDFFCTFRLGRIDDPHLLSSDLGSVVLFFASATFTRWWFPVPLHYLQLLIGSARHTHGSLTGKVGQLSMDTASRTHSEVVSKLSQKS